MSEVNFEAFAGAPVNNDTEREERVVPESEVASDLNANPTGEGIPGAELFGEGVFGAPNNFGYSDIHKEEENVMTGTLNALKTMSHVILNEEKTCEYTVKITKQELKLFVENQIPTQKDVYYTTMSSTELATLFESVYGRGSEMLSNVLKNYLPSSDNAFKLKRGVRSIMTIALSEESLRIQRQEAQNVVQLAEQQTAVEAEQLITSIDYPNIFDKRYAIPNRQNKANGTIEFYANTASLLCSFLGLNLVDIEHVYTLSVQELETAFYVNFRKRFM
nr:MAG TPA: hypothetical protein [Caudoviricetes sp.]